MPLFTVRGIDLEEWVHQVFGQSMILLTNVTKEQSKPTKSLDI